jgi:hypothetical protein
MPIQVRGVLVHAMSGTELSRVRTEFRLRLPEPINKSPLESRGADIVMQSCAAIELSKIRLLDTGPTFSPGSWLPCVFTSPEEAAGAGAA